MATVEDVMQSSLKDLIVAGSEASIEDPDAQDYIFALNNFMNAQIADGLNLTWTTVTGLTDTLVLTNSAGTSVINGALSAIAANVALEVAPQYGAPVQGELARKARAGLQLLAKIGKGSLAAKKPDTLPLGGGNQRGTYSNDEFFSGAV